MGGTFPRRPAAKEGQKALSPPVCAAGAGWAETLGGGLSGGTASAGDLSGSSKTYSGSSGGSSGRGGRSSSQGGASSCGAGFSAFTGTAGSGFVEGTETGAAGTPWAIRSSSRAIRADRPAKDSSSPSSLRRIRHSSASVRRLALRGRSAPAA